MPIYDYRKMSAVVYSKTQIQYRILVHCAVLIYQALQKTDTTDLFDWKCYSTRILYFYFKELNIERNVVLRVQNSL